MENKTTKKTMGRRKIEIKKIEKKSNLQVTFTKRRRGLFRKASELVLLCGAEISILVQSPADKIFTFEHPSTQALINRLTSSSSSPEAAASSSSFIDDDGRRKYEEATKMVEMEKRRMIMRDAGIFWWEEPFEGLELHELEEFLEALEALRENVNGRVEEFEKLIINGFSTSTSSIQDFSGFSTSTSSTPQLGFYS